MWKKYVEVLARFDKDGNITPTEIFWDDGRSFRVDKILEIRRAASLKGGGIGLRFTCLICFKTTYLFFEDPKWFVEVKS